MKRLSEFDGFGFNRIISDPFHDSERIHGLGTDFGIEFTTGKFITKSDPSLFNPFNTEKLEMVKEYERVEKIEQYVFGVKGGCDEADPKVETHPKQTQEPEAGKREVTIHSFVSSTKKEMQEMQVQPIPPTEPEENYPMIQPRDKEGNRQLYKYPKLPRVGQQIKSFNGKEKNGFFLLVGNKDLSHEAHLLQFDGAANPNPGPASSGAVLWSPVDLDGKRRPICDIGKYLGKATNNIAEIQGLLLGLKIAAIRQVRCLLIEGDSELIIYQQLARYKVSHKNLKVWWSEIQAAFMDETSFDWIAIRQVPREHNERADSITKEVLGRKEGFQRFY